jgi:hypothetical protein
MRKIVIFMCVFFAALPVFAQAIRDDVNGMVPAGSARQAASVKNNAIEAPLPLRRLALFSSGVGYFEHSGAVSGTDASPASITLPFNMEAVNDALKSLVVNDPSSVSPSVRYASSQTLTRTLRSLKIDLSGEPGIGEILNGLKGAELEVSAPLSISGRIIGVEYRNNGFDNSGRTAIEAWLSLFTSQGIKVIAVKEISSFSFKDEKINADLHRALDLIMDSRDVEARNLLVTLPGVGSRNVVISYVIPTPVWKVSYRLDLAGKDPFLQGWAIVDNDSDTDWNNIELSLVTGRPVSFIQNLYPPYHLARPVLPLAIAGTAEGRSYESGYGTSYDTEMAVEESAARKSYSSVAQNRALAFAEDSADYSRAPVPSASVTGGVIETAAGSAAGDQFEFTMKKPVTLERRQSAMLPLVEGKVTAEKALVLSGSRLNSAGAIIHPAISAALTNTTGMKLPAGPITVYDGGTYAGDALIEFFPENERRIISFGEDLSVTGSAGASGSRLVTAVSIQKGIMTISRRQSYEKIYTVKNNSGEAKKLIIEHPVTQGASLSEPAKFDERTGTLYRFNQTLPQHGELVFTVREDTPLSERITLTQLRPETFFAYTTNQEIPAAVRTALQKAVELKQKADDEEKARQELENRKTRLVSDQARIRQNLEAAGNQTQQGQEYLKRLVSMDGEIDALNIKIEEAGNKLKQAQAAYENYLSGLNL